MSKESKIAIGIIVAVLVFAFLASYSWAKPADAIVLPNVTICHNGNTISVAIAAVPAHLGHGDTLGPCPTPSPSPSPSPSATPTPSASPLASPTVEPSATPEPSDEPTDSSENKESGETDCADLTLPADQLLGDCGYEAPTPTPTPEVTQVTTVQDAPENPALESFPSTGFAWF